MALKFEYKSKDEVPAEVQSPQWALIFSREKAQKTRKDLTAERQRAQRNAEKN